MDLKYAAIDLGSNSFHLVVLESQHGKLVPVISKREMVQLVAGIQPQTGILNQATRERALRCLAAFRHELKQLKPEHIRAVGTSAFRQLAADHAFLTEAQATLGCSIEILSGEEEAHYIFQGVRQQLPQHQSLFVIDIGGGSTEIIVGAGSQPDTYVSLDLGCITLTHEFFNSEDISEAQFERAEQRVRDALHEIAYLFDGLSWQMEIGCSGTVKSVLWALQNLNLTPDSTLTRTALTKLRPVFFQTDNNRQLSQLLNINPRRTQLLAAGFVILYQTVLQFDLHTLVPSHAAIREGLIYELTQG